jgi:hypothetical protein
MPIVSTDDGFGGSTALVGSSSVVGWSQHALGCSVDMRVQRTTALFFYGKPYLEAIGMLRAKVGQGTSCAQASSHRERGL